MVKRTQLLVKSDKSTAELETYQELQDRITINADNLDEEIIAQPSLYHRIAAYAVRMNAERDQAKEEMKNAEAQASLNARARLSKSGEKVTEGIVQAEMREDHEFTEAIQKYLNKSGDADLAQSLREAFIQRSHCLRDLVNLTTCGWMQSSSLEKGTGESGYQAARQRLANERRKG